VNGAELLAVLAQTVQRAHFAGERTQRGGLHILFVLYTLQLAVVLAQCFLLLAHLIEAGRLEQHAGVRAGHAGDSECAHHGRGHEHAGVVQGDRDLAERPVFLTCNENDVITCAQVLFPDVPGVTPQIDLLKPRKKINAALLWLEK
jgi:hypothetical protein